MNNNQPWDQVFISSMQDLWTTIVHYVPTLLGAFVVLVIGLFASSVLSKFAKKIFVMTHLDDLAKKIGLSREMEGMGLNFRFVDVVGWVVKWFFIIVTLIAVADIIEIPQLTEFLASIALYIPNVLVAVVLLAVGLVAGRFVQQVVTKSFSATSLNKRSSAFLSALAKWAILIFASIAALLHLGIARSLLEMLFAGIVFMLALAGGLAFGLGGKDAAGRAINWIDREVRGQGPQ